MTRARLGTPLGARTSAVRLEQRRGPALAIVAVVMGLPLAAPLPAQNGAPLVPAGTFTIEQVKSYPFPTELTAAPDGSRIAWAMEERGLRNVYVAEGPSFEARRLTAYRDDDGQELTSVQLSRGGAYVVYVRGGDHGANWAGASPNPLSLPAAPKIQLWSVAFGGGAPKLLADGDDPVVSPKGDVVAFVREGAIWTVPVDGSAPARKLFGANGTSRDPQWSPDGSRLAFVSDRGDHAFVGVYSNDSTAIRWIAPSTSRDAMPRWSPDGRRVAFVRLQGTGGSPDSVLVRRHVPWGIWTADVATGEGRRLWQAPRTLRGSVPTTQGGPNLQWAAGDRIVFLSNVDGWPHLYSLAANAPDGTPLLLTPGRYMAEYITLSPDRQYLVFAANAGDDADDIDRRHVVKAPVDRAAPQVLTPGSGLEWTPVVTGDGQSIAFIGATAQRPPLPAVISATGVTSSPAVASVVRWIAADRIPSDFPTSQLVAPRKVVFRAPDGTEVHAQLFEQPGTAGKRPAIVYVHGGPPRQMLLGWHYSDYYTNAYASNQYLASKGYVVLSVNYRLGIGYGHEFHRPPNAGEQGAAEYQDVLAGARYLQGLADVDPKRVGIYGGSYGGFLVALALGRNSDVFAAGVDMHGVHDWTADRVRGLVNNDRYEKAPDAQRAVDLAWRSSPVSSIATWRSPVLLIHGDDDRNVRFSQTVDLARRLERARVPFEELVIVDDTHHMMRHANWVRVDSATADFFNRKLGRATGQTAARPATP